MAMALQPIVERQFPRHIRRLSRSRCYKHWLGSDQSSKRSRSDLSGQPSLSLSSTSLGLLDRFVKPHLSSIQQLPEVSSALQDTRKTDDLRRASEIFASFQAGGNEHRAALALLAESLQRTVQYQAAMKSLLELEQFCTSQQDQADIHLARAKLLWLLGDFAQTRATCEVVLEMELPRWYEASARTGLAIAEIMMVSTLEDIFSVRDPFRMVVKLLERMPTTALALAQLNFGVAEAIYASVLQSKRDIKAPLDGAMRSWKQGLTTLKKLAKDDLSLALQARLNANLAWGLLQMEHEKDHVERASEYAGKGLTIYDKELKEYSESFGRTLSLVAQCYQKAGSAVTAEGLFQSAVDKDGDTRHLSPLQLLEKRDILQSYGRLYHDWERRESDAKKLDEQASRIDDVLPASWKGKSSVHASFWFWTPSLLSTKIS